jgi:tRNA(fMet)-specific endonuclease VapC
LAAISSAKQTTNLIAAYKRLLRLLLDYEGIEVHPFDDSAAAQFEQLRQNRVRIGTLDLRIASIALARNEMLLTRNTRDFCKVPGLRFEDWTR